jgi:tetratricopeptide (TPR) repeat protein
VTIASVLAPLHTFHGRYAEAEEVLRTAIALGPDEPEAARLLSLLGRVLRQSGRWRESLDVHVEADRILGHVPAGDVGAWWNAWLEAKLELASYQYYAGDQRALAQAIDALEPAVESHASPQQRLDYLHVRAQAAYRRERYVLSEASETLGREIHRRALADDPANADFSLGFCLLWRGKLEEAVTCLERGRQAARAHGDALIETRCIVYEAVARRKQVDVDAVRSLLDVLDAFDELHGYTGLVAANHAWVAYREGAFDTADRFAGEALSDWGIERGSAGPTVFQWTARFPMLGVELARNREDAAYDHARAMLDPFQQPLPTDLDDLLRAGLTRSDTTLLQRALERGAASGYA